MKSRNPCFSLNPLEFNNDDDGCNHIQGVCSDAILLSLLRTHRLDALEMQGTLDVWYRILDFLMRGLGSSGDDEVCQARRLLRMMYLVRDEMDSQFQIARIMATRRYIHSASCA